MQMKTSGKMARVLGVALCVWILAAGALLAEGTDILQGGVDSLFANGSGPWFTGVQVQNVGPGATNLAYYDAQFNQTSNADGAVSNVLPWEQPNINNFINLATFLPPAAGPLLDFIQWGFAFGDVANFGSVGGITSWMINTYNFPLPTTVNVGGMMVSGPSVAGTTFFTAPDGNFVPAPGGGVVQVNGTVTPLPAPGVGYQILAPTGILIDNVAIPGAVVTTADQSQ